MDNSTIPIERTPVTFDDLRKVADKMDQAKIERPPLDIKANQRTVNYLIKDIPPAELDTEKPGLSLALLGGIPIHVDEAMLDGQFKVRDKVYTVKMPRKPVFLYLNRIRLPWPSFLKHSV